MTTAKDQVRMRPKALTIPASTACIYLRCWHCQDFCCSISSINGKTVPGSCRHIVWTFENTGLKVTMRVKIGQTVAGKEMVSKKKLKPERFKASDLFPVLPLLPVDTMEEQAIGRQRE